MAGSRQKLRRWWYIGAAILLLVTGGQVAWRYRPLNTTEIWLIGAWTNWGADNFGNFYPEDFEFTADRRYSYSELETGSWSAKNDLVQLTPDDAFGTFLRTTYSQKRLSVWPARRLQITSRDPAGLLDISSHGERFVRGDRYGLREDAVPAQVSTEARDRSPPAVRSGK